MGPLMPARRRRVPPRQTDPTRRVVLSRLGLTPEMLVERAVLERRAREGDVEAAAELWTRWQVRMVKVE